MFLGELLHKGNQLLIISDIFFKGSHSKAVLYGSLFLTVSGINALSPSLGAWTANNVAPYTRRATAIAFLSMLTNSGGILSTWMLGSLSPPPRYTAATIAFLVFSIVMAVLMGVTLYYFSNENKKKQVIRETTVQADEPEGLGDRSAWYRYIL